MGMPLAEMFVAVGRPGSGGDSEYVLWVPTLQRCWVAG